MLEFWWLAGLPGVERVLPCSCSFRLYVLSLNERHAACFLFN